MMTSTGQTGRRYAVPVLFAVTLFSFLLIRLAPGDPVKIMLGLACQRC